MWRRAAAGIAVACLAPIPPAGADPAVPRPGSPCDPTLTGAVTAADVTLECTAQGWRPVPAPTPMSNRWVSFGPAVTVHGNGLRNPELESGDWTGTPLTSTDHCAVTQVAVLPGVGAGPPTNVKGEPGQPLSFTTPALVFSVEFSGGCLWQHR